MEIGFRRAWVRSAVTCVSISFDDIISNAKCAGKNYVVSKTLYLAVLGM